MFGGPGDEHERTVGQRFHMHEGAEVVQLARQRRLGLVPHDLRAGSQVLDVHTPFAIPGRNVRTRASFIFSSRGDIRAAASSAGGRTPIESGEYR